VCLQMPAQNQPQILRREETQGRRRARFGAQKEFHYCRKTQPQRHLQLPCAVLRQPTEVRLPSHGILPFPRSLGVPSEVRGRAEVSGEAAARRVGVPAQAQRLPPRRQTRERSLRPKGGQSQNH